MMHYFERRNIPTGYHDLMFIGRHTLRLEHKYTPIHQLVTRRATSQKSFHDNGQNLSFRGTGDQQKFQQGQCYKFEIQGKCTKKHCK